MLRHNLGKEKWEAREAKRKANLERIVNESLNRLFQSLGHKTLVTEDLRHTFSYNLPKNTNRRLSAWIKAVLQDRTLFKAGVFGVQLQAVKPAYSSQECYRCGYVDRKNRSGDLFTCQGCGMVDHADRVAAINLLRRLNDPEITRSTSYQRIKEILQARFHRPLEAEGNAPPEATVQGRTSDTRTAKPPTGGCRAKAQQKEQKIHPFHRSIEERNGRVSFGR